MPGMWLRHPTTETVLSIALARHHRSPRFKEVVHPSRRVFMHHLELNHPAEIDAQVVGWLREAYMEAV
jgi:hypothetical protein